jgi:hypothetical protein
MGIEPGSHYVALGSSFAAGPGIGRRAPGSPRFAMRSAGNYPHLVAEDLRLYLRDFTFSGARIEHILTKAMAGQPPQIEGVDADDSLVTVTVGGNDVGYMQGLMTALVPKLVRGLPLVSGRVRPLLDPSAVDRRLDQVGAKLRAVAAEAKARAPRARVIFVDYLTVLPSDPALVSRPLTPELVELGRHVAERLAEETVEAAAAEGCELVRASAASVEHHAWSRLPWTEPIHLPIGDRPAPLHPNQAGMRAVADLLLERLDD